VELPLAAKPRLMLPPPKAENRAKSLALLLTKKFEFVDVTVPVIPPEVPAKSNTSS